MSSNSDKERKWLVERYASMPLGQLEQTFSESDSLTDLTRTLLREEMNRRRPAASDLATEEPVFSGSDSPALINPDKSLSLEPKLVMHRFRDLPEALLAQGSLDSAGIASILVDDNIVRMDWFWSNSVGGIKLLVSPEDADEAAAILNQPIPASFEVSDGQYNQPSCPKCGSLDVAFEELNKPIAYTSAYIFIPMPIHEQGWTCHACGCRWEETDEVATE